MKKAITIILLMFASTTFAQTDTDTIPPYLKIQGLPSFRILLPDSTWFTTADLPKRKTIVLIYFSPECHHCQMTAEDFAAKMDDFKDVFFLWVSYHTPEQLKTFSQDYKLDGYDNVKMGRDAYYFFPPFYQIKSTPFMIAYNKDGKVLAAYDGGTNPHTLHKLLHK